MAMMKWCSIIVCLLTVGTKELRYVWCVFCDVYVYSLAGSCYMFEFQIHEYDYLH